MSVSVIIKNDTPVFLWVFMIPWMLLLGVFTAVIIVDAIPNKSVGPLEVGIIISFWIFGGSISRYCLGKPRVKLIIEDDEVLLRELWLLRHQDERFSLLDCKEFQIVQGKDGDGDPYFRLQISTPSGRCFTVAEHQIRSEVEFIYDRVIAATNQGQAKLSR